MLPHAAQYCKDAHQDLMPYLHQSLYVLLLSLSSPLINCSSFINKKELKWIICRPTRCAMASFNYGHGLRNPLKCHYLKIKGTECGEGGFFLSKCVLTNKHLFWFASAFLDGVLEPLRQAWYTWQCPCISAVPEAGHEVSRGTLKGAGSAQKALQGSASKSRDFLGGTVEISVR